MRNTHTQNRLQQHDCTQGPFFRVQGSLQISYLLCIIHMSKNRQSVNEYVRACVCVLCVLCVLSPVQATYCVSIIIRADKNFVGTAKAGWTPFAEVKPANKF